MKSRSRFSDAAGRLDRFVEEIKARQYDATGAGTPPVPAPRPLGHPDADWQQHYGTRSIRLRRTGEVAPSLPEHVLPPSERPRLPDPPVAAERDPVATNLNGPIGAVLGKPLRRRGFLGRLWGRDN